MGGCGWVSNVTCDITDFFNIPFFFFVRDRDRKEGRERGRGGGRGG